MVSSPRSTPLAIGAQDEARRRRVGLWLAGGGAVAASGKAIIVKLAYRYDVDAVTLLFYRMAFALPLFAALALYAGRGQRRLERRDLTAIVGLGFSGYYLASFLDFAGLAHITASLERLILYLNPTLVALLVWLLFKRAPTRRQLFALGVGYVGVLLVFGHEVSLAGSNVVLGAALVFGSALSYALYLIYSGEEVKRLGAVRLTGLATSAACVFCIAQFFLLRPVTALAVAPEVIALSALNATVCTFAPVLMVMLGIERVGAPMAAQAGMLGPLSTIAMGVVILGEPFNGWMVAGTALVLAGIWLFTRGARRMSPADGA